MDKTDRLLKQLKSKPIARQTGSGESFVLPNVSGHRRDLKIGNITLDYDGTDVVFKDTSGTTILSINMTTGNIVLAGTQKKITCSKIVGA